MLSWLDEKAVAIEASLQALRHERARASTVAAGTLQPKGVIAGVVELLQKLDGAQKQEAMAALREDAVRPPPGRVISAEDERGVWRKVKV